MLRFLLAILTMGTPPAIAASGENAIARLNYAGFKKRGHCTAVLISKTQILTARHCVEKWPIDDLRVVFGYARGEWVELRKVKKISRHKKRDLAVVCLDRPSAQRPIPIANNFDFKAVKTATLIGYRRTRAHLPTSKTCPLQPSKTKSRFECPLEKGMSGSPVFMSIDGERQIVGIASQTSKSYSLIERATDLPQEKC